MAYSYSNVQYKDDKIIITGRQFDGIERDHIRIEIVHPDAVDSLITSLQDNAKQWRDDRRKRDGAELTALRDQRRSLDRRIKDLEREQNNNSAKEDTNGPS